MIDLKSLPGTETTLRIHEINVAAEANQLRDAALREGAIPGRDALIKAQSEARTELAEALRPKEMSALKESNISRESDFKQQFIDDVEKYRADIARLSPDYNGRLNPYEFKLTGPDEIRMQRDDFRSNRSKLINEWEAVNDKKWPCYSEDVLDERTGTKIRLAGDRYDAHHPHPLKFGGQNTVDNITPVHVNDHYDHRVIHARSDANPLHRISEYCRQEWRNL